MPSSLFPNSFLSLGRDLWSSYCHSSAVCCRHARLLHRAPADCRTSSRIGSILHCLATVVDLWYRWRPAAALWLNSLLSLGVVGV